MPVEKEGLVILANTSVDPERSGACGDGEFPADRPINPATGLEVRDSQSSAVEAE